MPSGVDEAGYHNLALTWRQIVTGFLSAVVLLLSMAGIGVWRSKTCRAARPGIISQMAC